MRILGLCARGEQLAESKTDARVASCHQDVLCHFTGVARSYGVGNEDHEVEESGECTCIGAQIVSRNGCCNVEQPNTSTSDVA